MSEGLRLSASIVVYRPKTDVLARALGALHAAVTVAANRWQLFTRLYVIDNSCDQVWAARIEAVMRSAFPDGTATEARLLVSPRNCGYGQANNLVIGRLKSDYHLVMNPDVYPENEAIDRAIAHMLEDPGIGLLLADVHGVDGARQYLCKRDPYFLMMLVRGFGPKSLKRLFRRQFELFEMRACDYDTVIRGVEFPTGCFMFFRTAVLRRLGGFDPRFFLYFEDADIGRRARQIASVCYMPDVRIVHLWTRGAHKSWRLRYIAIRSGLKYLWKWGGFFILGRRPR
jgi:GT2 family glycosyltransferase